MRRFRWAFLVPTSASKHISKRHGPARGRGKHRGWRVEPHAGGGNPVLAISGENANAMFNDILGTSLGIAKDGGYSAIDKTRFGADSTDKTSFFTGKPYVEDLGYAFLFRNYRADLGKWQMRDLIGYPDGWNNLAYCGNVPSMSFDLFGTEWEWAVSQRGVSGFQHTWIEGKNNQTGERVTYSGLTPNTTAGSSSGGISSGGGSNGSFASSPDISGKEGSLNLYRNASCDYDTKTWGTENSVKLPLMNGMSGDVIANALNDFYHSYKQDTIPYGATTMGLDDFNCNSLTATLLYKLGFTYDQISDIFGALLGNHWGWNTRLPTSAFE